MIRDILTALIFAVFIWGAYVLIIRLSCGEWIWQVWRRKKELKKRWAVTIKEEKDKRR